EELGLPEAEEIPDAARQDPIFVRSAGADPGRDGCRVPLPWSGTGNAHGFSPAGAAQPWLPQPDAWAGLTVEAQAAHPDSMLTLYRRALAVRRAEPGLGDGPMTWRDSADDVLAFTRPGGFTCVVNLSGDAVDLPAHDEILLASGPLPGGSLPPDTAVWLRTTA
ncbi:MAG: DUF3459 domain-containing protein, partial [Hamadaea sp.]|nr:DUF3459 domain-containing protein [Hamadaea sp.]